MFLSPIVYFSSSSLRNPDTNRAATFSVFPGSKSLYLGEACAEHLAAARAQGRQKKQQNKQSLFSKALGPNGKRCALMLVACCFWGHMTHVSYCFPGCLMSFAETLQAIWLNCGLREVFLFLLSCKSLARISFFFSLFVFLFGFGHTDFPRCDRMSF